MSLIEQLIVVTLVGLLAATPIVTGGSDRDQLQLDASARRVQGGLGRARNIARREQRACGLSLSEEGFMAHHNGILPASLPACAGIGMALQEEFEQGPVVLNTNLPSVLRFTANGLLFVWRDCCAESSALSESEVFGGELALGCESDRLLSGSPSLKWRTTTQ